MTFTYIRLEFQWKPFFGGLFFEASWKSTSIFKAAVYAFECHLHRLFPSLPIITSWLSLLSFDKTSPRRSESGYGLAFFMEFDTHWGQKWENDGFNRVTAWRSQLFEDEPIRNIIGIRSFYLFAVRIPQVCILIKIWFYTLNTDTAQGR